MTSSRGPRVMLAALMLMVFVTGAAHAAAPAPRPWPAGAPRLSVSDPHVSEYLAYFKARAVARARARAIAPTANQLAYDVHYYDLDLHPDPVARVLTGTVRMLATVTAGPLTSVDLDFAAGMTVDSASAGGSPAAFTHGSDVLTVQLGQARTNGQLVDVTVSYHGDPVATGFGAFTFDIHNDMPLVWTLSEPFGAHEWWPCKDQPDDKADSVDVRCTVPAGMVTASNGTLVASTDDGVTAFTHWRERYPIASYLVSIASFAYATSSGMWISATGDTTPLRFFIFPDHAAGYANVNGKVPSMMSAFAARFGDYPFAAEKYGHAEFTWGGGMEHQTCTSLNSANEFVVAHELAHQWFGDGVTCRDFHHVWLNEGFATYCEALWAETGGGHARAGAAAPGSRDGTRDARVHAAARGRGAARDRGPRGPRGRCPGARQAARGRASCGVGLA